MRHSPQQKYDLLITSLKATITLAEENQDDDAKKILMALKQLAQDKLLKLLSEKSFKSAYKAVLKEVREQLCAFFNVEISEKKLSKLFKKGDKQWNKAHKSAHINFQKFAEHVNTTFSQMFMPTLMSQVIAELKAQLPSRRSLVLSEGSQLSPEPEQRSPEKKKRVLSSSHNEDKNKENKGFTGLIKTLSGRSIKASMSSPQPINISIQDTDSLEVFFNKLFDGNEEYAEKSVISLIKENAHLKDQNELRWGLSILNIACNAKSAQTLIHHLSQEELLIVFKQLWNAEETASFWRETNNLLSKLMSSYIESSLFKKYKTVLIGIAKSFVTLTSQITVQTEGSTIVKFSASKETITSLHTLLRSTLSTMLAPKQFPPIMQEIFKIAYADLLSRSTSHSDQQNTPLQELLRAITLHILNPIMYAATTRGTEKVPTIWQTILMKTTQLAIGPNTTPHQEQLILENEGKRVEKTLGRDAPFIQVFFGAIINDKEFKKELTDTWENELNTYTNTNTKSDLEHKRLPLLDVKETIEHLKIHLENNGLFTFKTDGHVVSPRKTTPYFFASPPTSPKTPRTPRGSAGPSTIQFT
jgi:hypothetical protein